MRCSTHIPHYCHCVCAIGVVQVVCVIIFLHFHPPKPPLNSLCVMCYLVDIIIGHIWTVRADINTPSHNTFLWMFCILPHCEANLSRNYPYTKLYVYIWNTIHIQLCSLKYLSCALVRSGSIHVIERDRYCNIFSGTSDQTLN